MTIELINTGSELMVGRVLNRHQQWLCRQLADRGLVVARQVAVSDTAEDIRTAVAESLQRAQLVITTGGLGPTSDDRTREVVADLLELSLVEDSGVIAKLEAWFRSRNRVMPDTVRLQAQVPREATVLPNGHGTAPGLVIPVGAGPEAWLIMLPGPPRELHPMFLDQVVPWLDAHLPTRPVQVVRTLRSTGVPESVMQERIAPPLAHLVERGLDIGYCARPGEVDVRFTCSGPDAPAIVASAEARVRSLLPEDFYGEEDDLLEAVVVRALAASGRTLAVAESCTGGHLANRITDVPGASEVFVGGAVTYSNVPKQSLLGVGTDSLAAHGAVSETVVREMAAGARDRFGTDFALATTGIAGPGGGTDTKPVGTVFIALAAADGVEVVQQRNAYDRETFKHVTSQQALDWLRRRLRASGGRS
ncbi:MAG: competence/damage-inducible protein A [Verrucomicrobiales bacterium]|nr:competence/damage-inducible protein A [Verrucomicrobiales bacterium]